MSNRPLSFSETLHQATQDMQDIDALFIRKMKRLKKQANAKKIKWRIMSFAEHGVAVTLGVYAIIDFANQRYMLGGFDIVLATIGAISGFDSSKTANGYADSAQELQETIDKVQDAITTLLPEDLHKITDTVRNLSKQNQK